MQIDVKDRSKNGELLANMRAKCNNQELHAKSPHLSHTQ